MGPELELKPKSEAAIEVSISKDGSAHQDLEDKFMPCVSNYKDNFLGMEEPLVGKTTASNRREDELLNGTGCTSPNDVQIVESECVDLTESSSSFGDSFSGTENGLMSDGDEAQSQLCGNNFTSEYDGYFGAFPTRKKKLTGHWRKFIHPIMWRMKWLELRFRLLDSLCRKYDSALAKLDNKKQSEFEGFTSEGFDAISASRILKRKKRKRVEDMTDIKSFMSHHFLFSYESKRSVANGVCMEDDLGDLGGKTSFVNNEFDTNDIWSSLEFGDGNSSLEDILWKIEVVRSQVCQLKTRIDKVVEEHPENFSSINNFLVPCDALKGSAQNPASPPENGNRLLVETLSTAYQHIECNMEDLFLPQSAVASHAELTPLPGMTGNSDRAWAGSVLENGGDGALMSNAAVNDVPPDFGEAKDQKPHVSLDEQKTNFPFLVSETMLPTSSRAPASETALPTESRVPVSETVSPPNSSVPNATQEPDSTARTAFPWNTRNQGKRKPGSYKWSRKS